MAQTSDDSEATDYLKVPGARLSYAVSGSGPVLLLIPGGFADGDSFLPLVDLFAEHFTVVRYDPRGISRSRLDGPADDVSVETHADDGARLLQAIGHGPASILGSSGGAVIGLALAERHPELVRGLVAHEPPLVDLLPKEDERRREAREISTIYHEEGADTAMAQFMVVSGLAQEEPQGELPAEAQEAMTQEMARLQQNVDFFFAHYYLPILTYVPDIAALRKAPTCVVVGVGEASRGQLAHDTALALAERLGKPAVTFPGDHSGIATHPEAFLERLLALPQAE